MLYLFSGMDKAHLPPGYDSIVLVCDTYTFSLFSTIANQYCLNSMQETRVYQARIFIITLIIIIIVAST